MLLNSFLKKLLLMTASIAVALPIGSFRASNIDSDGFLTECTGDGAGGTGICTNLENSQEYKCVIIPGQIIDCTSKADLSFQCVYVSSAIQGQSEFWCDSTVDQMLNNEFSNTDLRISGSIQDNSEQINKTESEADPQKTNTESEEEEEEESIDDQNLEVMTRIMMGETDPQ